MNASPGLHVSETEDTMARGRTGHLHKYGGEKMPAGSCAEVQFLHPERMLRQSKAVVETIKDS
jgi:hypothetical protein